MLYVGTSGWQYRDWRSAFYPRGVPQSDWLTYFSDRFATVEVNSTFYGLPTHETFAKWADQTPVDFVFTLKMSRYLTHVGRLKDPRPAVDQFFRAAEPLADKLGAVLLQLPPTLAIDLDLLRGALSVMPLGMRVAVEFRHPSWFSDEVRSLLEDHGAALCLADRGSRPVTPLWRTADWGYIRMHSGRAKPEPCYGRTALRHWTERITDLWPPSSDVYVFFNNDTRACALRDASRFGGIMAAHGSTSTRVPRTDEVTLRA